MCTTEEYQAWVESAAFKSFLNAADAAIVSTEYEGRWIPQLSFEPDSKLATLLGGIEEYGRTNDQYNSLYVVGYTPGDPSSFRVGKYDRLVFMGDYAIEIEQKIGPVNLTLFIHKTAGTTRLCPCPPDFVANVDPGARRDIFPRLQSFSPL